MSKLKLTDILRLLKAGYTKEEINELKDLETGDEPEPTPAEPEPTPAEPTPNPTNQDGDDIARLTEQIRQLTDTIQNHFRENADGRAPNPDDGTQVLKDIIEKGVI